MVAGNKPIAKNKQCMGSHQSLIYLSLFFICNLFNGETFSPATRWKVFKSMVIWCALSKPDSWMATYIRARNWVWLLYISTPILYSPPVWAVVLIHSRGESRICERRNNHPLKQEMALLPLAFPSSSGFPAYSDPLYTLQEISLAKV